MQLFLQLSHPQAIPRRDMHPATQTLVLHPDVNRVGLLGFPHGTGRKHLRVVRLRSFTFFMAFWPLDRQNASRNAFADVFTQRLPGTVLLQSRLSSMILVCNGEGAWDSFKASQGNAIIFDADE